MSNLVIWDRLIDEAMRLGGHSAPEETVIAALEEYIRYRKQLQILDLAGTIDYDPDYDYKKMRQLDRIEFD